ncbi:MAG: response regulator [Chloroflexia bacterium]|nr:response regulator [Chloroflexia bacterium]
MDPNAPRPRLEARQANERPHVLIVSDDPDLSGFLAEGLPLGGFWTSVIANGLQALEVFRLRQFDLVVVDAEMQNFDAVEFLRRLRGTSELDNDPRPRTTVPAVLIHATPPASPIDPGLGVAATLVAPLELDEIVRSLHQVFADWRNDHPETPLADSASLRAF